MRVGFLGLLLASASACIFDQSNYKQGGRLDQGATATAAKTDDVPSSSASTSTSTTSVPTGTQTTGTDAGLSLDTGLNG